MALRRLALVALAWIPGACGDYYELGIQGPPHPIAVGAAIEYHLQYAVAWQCAVRGLEPCNSQNWNEILSVSSVSVGDPTLLSAEIEGGEKILVRALGEGTTTLTATGTDIHGKSQTATRTFYLIAPRTAILSYGGLCVDLPQGSTTTLPISTDFELYAQVMNGTNELSADGLSIPMDTGALIPGSTPLAFRTPDQPVVTAVTSNLEQPFTLPIHVYDPASIDELALTPTSDAPHIVGTITGVRIELRVQGDRVCLEPDPPAVRTVTVLTPDVCTLRNGNYPTSPDLGTKQQAAGLVAIFVSGSTEGTCTVEISLAGTSFTTRVDLPITYRH